MEREHIGLLKEELKYEILDGQEELLIHVTCLRGDEVVYEKDVRANVEDDITPFCRELAETTGVDLGSVEQAVAEIITGARGQWLRSRPVAGEKGAEVHRDGAEAVPVEPPCRYRALYGDATRANGEPVTGGIWDAQRERFLSNFVLVLEEDITIQDDMESQRFFRGRLTRCGRSVPFEITAEDYSDNHQLTAALYTVGGPEIVISASMNELRQAISIISGVGGAVPHREMTTNFGWTAAGDAYLVPQGIITAAGFNAVRGSSAVSVDLTSEELARHLGMQALDNDELLRVKRHIVQDLLPCHDWPVTYALLGFTSLAVLLPGVNGFGRFALWLTGLTGTGKSFVAKLFANFFGDFPLSGAGRFATWAATANYIQRQGYFFKDVTYLVDDFKPEIIQAYQVTRVLQNYADGTGRGRLRADATTNVSRPVRGLLVSTGEDIPEHSASVVARSIVVPVPQRAKDLERGGRCVAECHRYSGVMADYIRWLMAGDRMRAFAERVHFWRQRYYSDVVGQQNDIRIAGNFALLAAAFELMAEYLGEVWPGWQEEVRRFTEQELVAIRNDMLAEVKEQQASEIFMTTLAELIRHGQVRIEGNFVDRCEGKPVIGRFKREDLPMGPVSQRRRDGGLIEISTSRAMEAVQESLRKQARRPLQLTDRALLNQLRQDGWLLDAEGKVVDAEDKGEPTQRTRIGGRQTRCFLVSRNRLLGLGEADGPEKCTSLEASQEANDMVQLEVRETLASAI